MAFILAQGGSLFDGLGINAFAFLSQLVSFGIVFLILWRWGFPAIIKMLNQRQAVIREGIENAERAKRELAEATNRAEQVLAHARAAQIEEQQVARIQQEAARAHAEISRLVVNLSIDAASKVIRKSLDSKDNRRLVEEFVSVSQAKEQ